MASKFLSFFFLSILLFSCQPTSPESENNQVVVRISSEPKSLHPVNGQSNVRVEILSVIAQHLVRLDPVTQMPAPLLAKALPSVSDDGLVYTYELDSLAAWEDGTPILATDVDFSLKAAVNPISNIQAGRSIYEHIHHAKLYPENDRKLSLIMRERYIDNPYVMNSVYIIDKRFFDPKGLLDRISVEELLLVDASTTKDANLLKWSEEFNDAKYDRDPAYLKGTSGPYMVTQWVPNQHVILSRRPNYWGAGKASHFHSQFPDRIIFKAVTDENSLALQMKQGDIDVATLMPSALYKQLRESEQTKAAYFFEYKNKYSYTYVGFNLRPDGVDHLPIFTDKNVRRAVSYVMPIDEIIQDFYYGQAQRIASPVALASAEYNREIIPLPYAPDSAKKLLDAAGWKDTDGDLMRDKLIGGKKVSLTFKLSYPAGLQSLNDIVERIVDAAAKVGLKIEADPLNMTVLQTKLLNRDFDALMIGSSTTSLPYNFKQLWGTESIGTGTNFFGFSHQEVDSLIEAANVELNTTRRKEFIDRIQTILYEEHPVIFFFSPPNYMMINKRFEHADMYVLRPHVLFNHLKLKN